MFGKLAPTKIIWLTIALLVVAGLRPAQSDPEYATDYDKRLIKVASRTPTTDQVFRSVLRGVAFLPDTMKRFFIAHGVTVVITPTLEDLGLPPGRSEYDAVNKRAIICERETDGTATDFPRLHINTLHELGHAYDHLLGYPSRKAGFREVYFQEALLVPQEHRARLAYFLQPGAKGARECFASLFACRYYRGDDRRLTALKASFPITFALVDRLNE